MKIILFFSHTLTEKQQEELSIVYTESLSLPPSLQKVWSQVPTVVTAKSLQKHIEPIFSFLEQNSSTGDAVLIQGEFGMTLLAVQWCFANGRTPLYATTERKAVERHRDDGTVEMTHVFEHAGFRKYEKLNVGDFGYE